MSTKHDKAPKPADLLFKNLFEECTPEGSFILVAEGLTASYRNADRLLSDAQYLVEGGRLSSARFLLTTAREEIAKSYILADACRLDLEKHDSVLRRLCRAFYDHISKHAYLKVLDSPHVTCMADARRLWNIEVRNWWPASSSDSEPDMPHDMRFDREFPLYIDYVDQDCSWHVPANSYANAYFEENFGKTRVSEMKQLIKPWREADLTGISSPKVLSILNSVFKREYIGEDATHEELVRLYKRVEERVTVETDSPMYSFIESPLAQWPLYHFA